MTPAERRALAQSRVANRENNALMNYYQDKQSTDVQVGQQDLEAERIKQEKENQNVLLRGLHTFGDLVGNVLTGAAKAFEGIYDLGAGIVGAVGGIFDDDFQDRVKDHIAKDYIGSTMGNFLQELTRYSYLKDGGIIEGVASGVGQMLPSVAITLATGGLGAPAMVSQGLSLATLGASATGNATEEAFMDGAEYYRGLGYGAVRGGTEVLTEKLFAGANKALTGAGFFDGIKIADIGARRVLKEAVEEGFEEVISEASNPLTKSIYKGADALKEYGDLEFWKGVGQAGVTGSFTSVAYGGTIGYGMSKIPTRSGKKLNYVGKEADINESITEMDSAREKMSNLQADGNLTKENLEKINTVIKGNWANIEKTLKSVNADKRKAIIKEFSLEKAINEDGSLNDTIKQSFATEQAEIDYYNRSVSLVGNDEKINKDTDTIRQSLAGQLVNDENITNEQAFEKIGDVSLYKGEFTSKAKQSRNKIFKVVNVINKTSNAKISVAILNPNKYFSANVVDGTLYIGADSLESDQWAKDLVHELTHLEEGTDKSRTKEYAKLVEFLSADDILVDDGNGGKINLFDKATNIVLAKGYGLNAEQVKEIINKTENGEDLTEAEKKISETFMSEVVAHESEIILGNETFIETIIDQDTSLAKRLFDRIFHTKKALTKVDGSKAEIKRLQEAEKLWLKSAKQIGNIQFIKYLQGLDDELKEKLQQGVEKEGKVQYNKKVYFDFLHKNFPGEKASWSEAHRLAVWWAKRSDTETGDQTLISIHDEWYLVEKFDDADNNYQVEEYITQEQFEQIFKEIKEYGRSGQIKSVQGSFDFYDKLNQSSNTFGSKKSSVDSYETQYRGKDNKMVRMASTKNSERERTSSDRSGDSESRSADRQGDNLNQNTFKDVTGKIRRVRGDGKGNYFVEGTKKHKYLYPSKEEAIKAENEYLAKKLEENNGKKPQFNLKEKSVDTKWELSLEHKIKVIANYTRPKVYSEKETRENVKRLVAVVELFTGEQAKFVGESLDQIVRMMWRGSNTVKQGKKGGLALDIADFIVKNMMIESIYHDANYDMYRDVINILGAYKRKFNLGYIKEEIKYRYGKDEARKIIAEWQAPKGTKGMTPDAIVAEVNELGFLMNETREADVFFVVYEAFQEAKQHMDKVFKTELTKVLDEENTKAIKQELAKEILTMLDESGQPSKLTKIRDKYKQRVEEIKANYKKEIAIRNAEERVVTEAKKIANFKDGIFYNSTKYKPEIFKGSIERLSKIIYRGRLNKKGTRKLIADIAEWYRKDNPILEGFFDENIAEIAQQLADKTKALTEDELKLLSALEIKSGIDDISKLRNWYTKENLKDEYSPQTKQWLVELASPTKFTLEELQSLEALVSHLNFVAEHYQKVWKNGKLVEAKPLAEKYIEVIRKNTPVKVGWLQKWFQRYITGFSDPMTVARYFDRYRKDGFYSNMLKELRKASINALVAEMEMKTELDQFLKEHKEWNKNFSKRTINLDGTEISVKKAITLYMTLNREQALLGLAKSGCAFTDSTVDLDIAKDIAIDGFAKDDNLSLDEIREKAIAFQDKIGKLLTETDFEYISIAEKLFNDVCKKLKMETDQKLKGYTNILDDYYIPLIRYAMAKSIDSEPWIKEADRASNASFNKDTVKGAKGQLFIDDIDKLLNRHIHGIAMYANLSETIQNYDVLFGLDISDNPNKPVNINTVGVDMWRGGNEYFQKLLKDIQGIKTDDGFGQKWLGHIRSAYVKFQLGLNLKTLATQTSSYIASTSILDADALIKAFGITGKDVDKYCPLAKLRDYDNTAYIAQGVLDKVNKAGDWTMKPISKVDRGVIIKLFAACQLQVQKDSGIKVETEENKVKAGDLLTEVILETQQNSLATERSQAMRSSNEVMRTLVMFSADGMKVIGRVMDSIGEYCMIKKLLKETTDQAEIAELNKQLKASKKKMGKSVGALVGTSVLMAIIAQLFKTLYNKDDEEEEIAKNMTVDAVGNLLGGLPIIKDIYAYFADGFDMDMYAYSTVNDLLNSAKDVTDTVGNVLQGKTEQRDIMAMLKNLLFTTGQLTGIPTRNVYNTVYGLTKRFSPETAYKFDNMLYQQSYRADLEKAIEKGDEDMMATIAGLILDENVGGINDANARQTMNELLSKGYDVIPRSVSNVITYDDVEYELTSKQKEQFKKVYNTSNDAIADLVKLSQFKEADDEVKAKTIKYIYNVYYNLALQDFLGVSIENKNILFAEAISIEKLALIACMANSIKAEVDKNGKAINGSRKRQIQALVNALKLKAAEKYMIMGYLGYSNINGEDQVKAYINRLKLTRDEKDALLQYSGYNVA